MDTNPYQPPAPSPGVAPPPFSAGTAKPASIQVFGVIHTVFAGLGVLGVVMMFFLPFLRDIIRKSPSQAAVFDVEAQFQWLLTLFGYINAALTLVLLIAGVKLLRSSRGALAWSNAYAGFSILSKTGLMVTNVVYTGPAKRAAYAAANLKAQAFATSPVFYILVGIIGMTYAILTLIFLNQPRVKAWFAQQGA